MLFPSLLTSLISGICHAGGQPSTSKQRLSLFTFNSCAGKFWFNTALEHTPASEAQFTYAGWLMGQLFANRASLGIPFPEVLFEKLLHGTDFRVRPLRQDAPLTCLRTCKSYKCLCSVREVFLYYLTLLLPVGRTYLSNTLVLKTHSSGHLHSQELLKDRQTFALLSSSCFVTHQCFCRHPLRLSVSSTQRLQPWCAMSHTCLKRNTSAY